MTITEKLRSFADLKEDWDSYGALPIGPHNIVVAEVIIEAFGLSDDNASVVPSNCGGVEIAWSMRSGAAMSVCISEDQDD